MKRLNKGEENGGGNSELDKAIAGQETAGDYRVGRKFNPGKHDEVDETKQQASAFITFLTEKKNATACPERKRLYSLAITAIEEGAMWGVKAATKPEVPVHLIGNL